MITLTKAQLKDKQAFVKRYLGKGNNASLSEVDPNSNVSHKTIATMEGEVNKDVHVQMNRHILGEKIKEVFGKKAMKQYYKDLNSHLIYKNDESSLKPYCVALSLIPFLEKGASALAGDSKAPKHLASFCGSYVNLMYALAGQFSGAIAEVSLLFYFHYFAKKDYGDNYLHTHGKEIENYFQQLVYSINSPAGARNHQSIFYNTSIWDRYYYDAMFGGAVYPDGSIPIYDEFHKLQKFFMNWFGEERHKALLTFPVVTCCYLTKDDKPRDEEFVDFLAEQLEKGHSFFHYQSDKASALSSCCFVGDQEVLIKDGTVQCKTFKELWDTGKTDYEVLHDGAWNKGTLIRVEGKTLYKVSTEMSAFIVTEDHLNVTMRGDVPTNELQIGDELLVNMEALEGNGLTIRDGARVGIALALDQVDGTDHLYRKDGIVRLNPNVLSFSRDFRRGILKGYYDQSQCDASYIATNNEGVTHDLIMLATSLGLMAKKIGKGFSLYHDEVNAHTNIITDIKELSIIPDYVYCFEMENEPYFTLPNGIITHNCRLRNEVEMNQFAYSLGGTGMMTGSLSVITLNVNHAIQKKIDIKKKVQEIHQYLIAFRMLIQEFKDAGILPAYDEGYIDIEKQYVTVGLNGIVEAAEYLGYEISNNEPYKKWLQELLGTVSSANRESAKYYTKMLGKKVLINAEQIPAENVGTKFRKWDTERGITSKRECYNSYFYIVEDEEIDIFDKFALHGGDILQYLDGGSCLHLNLDELPNKETWKKIINIAIENGTSYWTSNVKSTCCDDCGYINMHTKDSCIKCGSTNVSYATRVIGYLKKIKSFSKDRQIEAKKRHYHIDNK